MFPLSVKFLNCTPFAMMEHQHFLGNQDSVLYRFIIFPPRLSQAKHSTTRGLGHCIKRHNPLCRNHHEKLYLISILFPVVILPSQIPSFWDSGIFIERDLGLIIYIKISACIFGILLRDDGCSLQGLLMSWRQAEMRSGRSATTITLNKASIVQRFRVC